MFGEDYDWYSNDTDYQGNTYDWSSPFQSSDWFSNGAPSFDFNLPNLGQDIPSQGFNFDFGGQNGGIDYGFNLDSQPQQNYFDIPQFQSEIPQFFDVNYPQVDYSLSSSPAYESQYGDTKSVVGGPQDTQEESGILDTIGKLGGNISNLLSSSSGLLPLLFLGSGLLSSKATGNTAKTLEALGRQQQQEQQKYNSMLDSMLISGVGRPDISNYRLGSENYQISPMDTKYIEQLQAAISDPRYGLESWMSGEGGIRSEQVARQMAKAGRTGLTPLARLQSMRDYLSTGRQKEIDQLRGLADVYNQQEVARMQAEAQQANQQLQAETQRYNTDVSDYQNIMNVLQRQSDPSNYLNMLIASSSAAGQQYNPILNALANYMGRYNANA